MRQREPRSLRRHPHNADSDPTIPKFQLLLLLGWIAVGASLRFAYLSSKSPWTDELITLVFSLGHSFRTVLLNQVLTLDQLLSPLQPDTNSNIVSVVQNLMTESTHPPVYFVLAHLWLKLFPTDGGLVSLWAVRALSALLGVAAIPALFGFSWLAFRSWLVSQIAAALMAISPFGIYLAQEARQYTLVTLLLIASLSCLVVAVRSLYDRVLLSGRVVVAWIMVNSLGVAVHYFFILPLVAEALVLLRLWVLDYIVWVGVQAVEFPRRNVQFWLRIYIVAASTLMSSLVWLQFWRTIPKNDLTHWIYQSHPLHNFMEPIARILLWTMAMVILLPIEGQPLPVQLLCGAVMIIFTLWMLQILIQSIKIQWQSSVSRLSLEVLGGFMLGVIALILGITYSLGADLTLAARYLFVYFPVVLVLWAVSLSTCWHPPAKAIAQEQMHQRIAGNSRSTQKSKLNFQNVGFGLSKVVFLRCLYQRSGKKAVALIMLISFVGGLMVVSNLGYQKADRPDLVVSIMAKQQKMTSPQVATLIAMVHKNYEQTTQMMGLAWEFKHHALDSVAQDAPGAFPQFLLAHKDFRQNDSRPATIALNQALAQLPRPLDLWIVNFTAAFPSAAQKCVADSHPPYRSSSYKYQLFHCL